MLTIKQILAPIDWSECSNRAFKLAVSLAGDHGARLVVLHVVPPPVVMYGPAPESYLKHLREELCRLVPCDSKVPTQHLLAEGDPAAAILRAAQETHCGLIVMGTHGRCGLNRLISGSVAEEVVRRAPCPVLTVNNTVPAEMIPAISEKPVEA